MAQKKYLDMAGLTAYDSKIKAKITSEAQKAVNDAASNYDPAGTAQTKVDALSNGQVKTNKEAIAKLNGADTVEGSVAKAIKDAKTELEGKITASSYDDTALSGRVTATENAITTLNGTGTGSVDKKVADAVAAIVADAPDAYDTLKEISDWISSHANSASGMNTKINANEAAINDLTEYVGTLPNGTPEGITVVDYMVELLLPYADIDYVDVENGKQDVKINANETAIATLEQYVGKFNAQTNCKTVVEYSDFMLTETLLSYAETDYVDTENSKQDAKITALEAKVGDGFTAISADEINALFA